MTQKETLLRGQIKSQEGQSKSLHENAKQANDGGPTGKEVMKKHIEIVERLFDDDDFDIKPYQIYLQKRNHENRNLIHQVIFELKRERVKAPLKALKIVEELVLIEPNLFAEPDKNNQVPLVVAAEFSVEILFQVIDLVTPDSVLERIKIKWDDSHHSCPLNNVLKVRRDQCLKPNTRRSASPERTQQRERSDRPKTPKAIQAGIGDVNFESPCLCDLIDIDQVVKKDTELRGTLSRALGLQIAGQRSCLQLLIADSRFDPTQGDMQIMTIDSFRLLLQLCPDNVFENATQNGYSPLQMAIRLYDKQGIDYNHLSLVIQALVDRYPSSVFFQAGYEAQEDKAKTVYRLLKELKETDSELNARSRSRTEELLKKTCIGSPEKNWDSIIGFLYWDAKSVRHICLNLSGESLLLDKSYISTIRDQSGMRFETVLNYVKLPYWNPQDCKPRDQDVAGGHRGASGDEAEDSDPYTAVFEWLWASYVRKIFTVEVDDDGPDPHTNTAIRQCLRGSNPLTNSSQDFEIEIWKWKKFDICSETLFKAAPMARESAKDEKDCKHFEQELKRNLSDRCSLLEIENITVEYDGCQATHVGSNGEDQEEDHKDEKKCLNTTLKSGEWIEKLFAFKQFINGVLGAKEKPSVKLALLDDGTKLTGLDGKQKGKSFRPDNEEYFVGPCTHGTEMAWCIRAICPMAELYVARLDDSQKVENQKFTTASAYKALQWAMSMDVDIISMSCTFKRKGVDNDEDEKDFVSLIQRAVSLKKFILFGSLPDKGPTTETREYAPVGLDGVIEIGSATMFGQLSKENLYASPNFLLPGEELETQAGEIVSGSSFSTAYASGLAALVLCCLKAHMELEDQYVMDQVPNPEDIRTKRLNKAKTFEGMMTIFRNLSGRSDDEETKKSYFVRPYTTLRGHFGDSEEEKLRAVRDIVTEILPPKVLRTS